MIIDNCEFVPIIDELKEITYINRYFTFFDPRVSNFVTSDLIQPQIEETYNDKLIKLDKEDKFYAIKLNCLKTERMSNLEAADNFDKKNKKNKRRLNLIDYAKRKDEAFTDQKIKGLIDFDEEYCSSIRSLAVKKSVKVNLTTRYLNGKMLMFSKISLKSFVYDLIDIFMFPNNVTKRYISNIKSRNVIFIKI